MGSRSTSDYIRIPMFDGREGDLFRKKYRVLQLTAMQRKHSSGAV